jgi:hypothetical protein
LCSDQPRNIGSQNLTPDKWHTSIIRRLVRTFKLSNQFNQQSSLSDPKYLSAAEQLNEFIEDVLLAEILQNIVIFFDEIDSILDSARDDFLTTIRSCYNNRADNPEYRRLTFAVLGVAAPSDLIADKNRTLFEMVERLN